MSNPAAFNYALAGGAFALLGVLILLFWRDRENVGLLLVACATQVLWAFGLGYLSVSGGSFAAAFSLEVARDGAWLAYLIQPLWGGTGTGPSRRFRLAVYAGIALILAFGLVWGYSRPFMPSVKGGSQALIYGGFLLSLTGLVLVEQVYRNTRIEQRWAIKFLCLGLGGLFAYDLYQYTDGLLFRVIDPEIWSARGLVGALLVPVIAISLSRNPTWSRITVSRKVVFYTAGIISVGLYLLAIAAGGYYIRIFGGSWGAMAQTVLFFGALVVLFTVLFSGSVRARLRVFLSKHFFHYKYDYRDEWLRLIQVLSAPTDDTPLPERAISALAQIVESPGGGLWIQRESEGFVPIAGYLAGPNAPRFRRDEAFLRFLSERHWIIDLDELRRTPDVYHNLILPDWLSSPTLWLIIPLCQEHDAVGFVVLERPRAAQKLNWEDIDLLRTAGRQVASYLTQNEAAQALAESRQFQAFNRLTAFIMHDLKNLIAQQSLVVKNAAKYRDNPDFIEDAIKTIDNSVQRMQRLLGELKQRTSSGYAQRVNLTDLAKKVIEEASGREPRPQLEYDHDEIFVHVESERLTMVLQHLIENAQEATPADGQVRVVLRRQPGEACVDIIDTGSGMDPKFVRDRLFRPFDSTKGSKGMGIGAYQAREFVRSAGGDLKVTSEPRVGSHFTLSLPIIAGERFEAADRRTEQVE